MKILVLGSSGMLGHVVYHHLTNQGHDVMGISRTEIEGINSVKIDVYTQLDKLYAFIDKDKPEVIVNCIGLLIKESDQDHTKAIFINSLFPHMLSQWCLNYFNGKIKLIHISTDCVFNGDSGPYEEVALPTEINWYGRTKALGELDNAQDLTIRTSIIGPDLDINGEGLLNWFMKQKGEVKGYTNVWWSGVTTLECAKAINSILKENINLHGIYHLTSSKPICKYGLLKLIKKVFGKFNVKMNKVDEPQKNKVLLNTRLGNIPKVLSYEKQLVELKEFIKNS